MSIAAPPRTTPATPYAESQPQPVVRRASPDWLPVIGWFVDDGVRHSRINVIPFGNTTDAHERFGATLKFFRGADDPVHTFISQPFAGDQTFRYESTDLLAALGESSFEGLVEITARSLDNPPGPFPWVDSWLEFSADDKAVIASLSLLCLRVWRISSPMGVPPGSRNTRRRWPSERSFSDSNEICVDLPHPSVPSKVMNNPFITVSSASVPSACPR